MKKSKKQRIVYKEDASSKAAELEEFLFGKAADGDEDIFNREKDELEATVAELVHKASKGAGGLLHDDGLFFMDTHGQAGGSDDDIQGGMDLSSISDQEDEAEEGEEEEREGGSGAAARRAGRAAADNDEGEGGSGPDSEGGRSSADDDEDEEQEGDVQRAANGAQAAPSGRGQQEGGAAARGRRAVWADPDDASVAVDVRRANRLHKLRASDKQTVLKGSEYEAALRKQHQALNPRTAWASHKAAAAAAAAADGADADGAEALLTRAGGLLDGGGALQGRLPAGLLETTRLKDANQHDPSGAVVQALQFHPNGQVLLTAGLDKKLRLFQVDGLRNPKLQTVHFDDMPLHCAAFAGGADGGGAVVATGRRPHFYVYDLGAGRLERVQGPAGCKVRSLETMAVQGAGSAASPSPGDPLIAFCADGGFIPLVSLRTRQWQASLKMSGSVRALAFTPDGHELLSTGGDGLVAVWDLRMRRCRLQFEDAGNVGSASSLAISPDSRWIATGAASGVVNVYSREAVEAAAAAAGAGRARPAPARELMNLTTNVDTLRFSPDSQVLALASRMKRDALRLLHLPSLTVFSNWPTSRSPLHYVHCLDFSPRCGLLSIGNAKGRALLYRLHHYGQA